MDATAWEAKKQRAFDEHVAGVRSGKIDAEDRLRRAQMRGDIYAAKLGQAKKRGTGYSLAYSVPCWEAQVKLSVAEVDFWKRVIAAVGAP